MKIKGKEEIVESPKVWFLAINHGPHEGWTLTPYDSPHKALQVVKKGEAYGNEWKILKEVDIIVNEAEESF